MKMRIFFLSILLYTITKADASDSKYIDLLPEKEKQEFLEKIARRILEEVQTKDDRPEGSSEIPDEQLNEHDAFVHKILKEETENLRRQNNNTHEKSDKNNKIGRILAEDGDNKGDRYIDLTLRTDRNRSKRESKRVFTGFSPDKYNSTEDNSKESDVDILAKKFRRTKHNLDETTALEQVKVTTNIYESDYVNKTGENETVTKDQNNKIEVTRQYQEGTEVTTQEQYEHETEVSTQDNLNDVQNTPITKKDSNDENENTTTYYEKTTEYNDHREKTESTTQDSLHNLPTDETITEPVQLDVIQKTYENINYDNSKKTNENKLNANAALSVETTKTPENTDRELMSSNINAMLDMEPNKGITKASHVINIEIARVQETEDAPSTTKSNDNITKNKNSVDTISITTEETKLLTPTTQVITDPKVIKEKDMPRGKIAKPKSDKVGHETENLKKKQKSLKVSVASKKFASDVIKALRLKLLDKSDKNDNFYYKTLQYAKMKPIEHNVFEISPDASPFFKQKSGKQLRIPQLDKIKTKSTQPVIAEQPYHVPIHNYLPNNAFYNPQNAFGPNPDSEDEGNFFRDDEGGYKFPSLMPKSANNLMQKEKPDTVDQPFHVPVYYYSPKNAYYNSKNYYGPNLQDSNEEQNENHNEYDNASYDIDKNEELSKERDQIEWQYYYDPHIRVKDEETPTKKKKSKKGEPFEVNLPKSVVDFISSNTNIDLKGYIDTNYNNKEKRVLRCRYKKKCKTCNYEPKFKEKQSPYDAANEEVKAMPMMDNMSKIRHTMLEAKHFMQSQPADTSRLEEYFEEKKPDVTQNELRSSLPYYYEDLFKRDKTKQNYQNIAVDYYERYNDDFNSVEKQLKTNTKHEEYNSVESKYQKNYNDVNPIKLIYYKNPIIHKRSKDFRQNHKKPIQEVKEKYKKPQDFVENNKLLQDFLQKYTRPQNFAEKTKKTLKEYQELAKFILRYAKGDKKTEYDMKETTEFIKDKQIMEIYLQLEKLEQDEAKLKAERSSETRNELDVYEEVIGDMIKENNKALENYDWLETAVDLQSAIKKMVDIVESVQNGEDLYPSDLELLKYMVYLHTNAQDEISQKTSENGLGGMVIPHGKQPRHLIREAKLFIRGWAVRHHVKDIPEDELDDFGRFLEELETALYDLHTALKYIAMVTKYKNQNWFESLKQIHIDSNRKQLLELILHLCTTRLLGMIEDSSKNGLEDSFMDYVKKNDKEVARTRDEFGFVLKLLEEIKCVA